MADYLTRACRLQLTTAMENLIRTAVFEISQIFEDSLHDHQMELARKGEEIAYLKVKLQNAELKLKDVAAGSGPDLSLNTSLETPTASEDFAPLDSPTVPEIDYEVPDDWCVPLGSDNANKQENPCPSVRLKQFSIPLFPIPLKHEAFSRLDLSKRRLRSHQDCAQTGSQEEIKPKRGRGRPRQSEKNNEKNVPMNIKKESFYIQDKPLKRGVGRPAKKRRQFTNAKIQETQPNTSGKTFLCRYCPKEFDKQCGLDVHERAHKKCKGCKRLFLSPSDLMQHKTKCLLKMSRASPKDCLSKNTSSIKEEKSVESASSVGKLRFFTCKCCGKKFESRSHFMQHPCFVSCKICNKRLSSRMALTVHTNKMHKALAKCKENGKDTSWTTPLDETESNQEQPQDSTPFLKAREKIKACPEGYKCLICKKVYSSKYTAWDHIFFHTGEKPFKCAFCPQRFAQRNALTCHRKKRHGYVMKKHIRCACSKSFFDLTRYKTHKLTCPKAGK